MNEKVIYKITFLFSSGYSPISVKKFFLAYDIQNVVMLAEKFTKRLKDEKVGNVTIQSIEFIGKIEDENGQDSSS